MSNPPRHSTSYRRKKMLQRTLRASEGLAATCKGKAVSGNISHPLCTGDGGAGQPRERLMRVARGLGRGTAEGAVAVAVVGKAPCAHPSANRSSPSEKPQGLRYSRHTPDGGEKSFARNSMQ